MPSNTIRKGLLITIITMFTEGKTVSEISNELNIPGNTVPCEERAVSEKERTGRPRKNPNMTDLLMQREVKKNPRLTSKELKEGNQEVLGDMTEKTIQPRI